MLILPIEHDLLRKLVATPSVSGTEELVALFVERWALEHGLDVTRDETGVKVQVAGNMPGATLALVSHLDVVPPGDGWTRDPFGAQVIDGCLYGRGSGDAKASVAAMLAAALRAKGDSADFGGHLLVILGYGEETRHTSMPRALANTRMIDAAVIGEPTNLDFAIAQRGLMMIDLVAKGDQRHAAYA
ncbi:MAG: M20 family metallopeptidase, partial [Gemmatimonadales bacterium]